MCNIILYFQKPNCKTVEAVSDCFNYWSLVVHFQRAGGHKLPAGRGLGTAVLWEYYPWPVCLLTLAGHRLKFTQLMISLLLTQSCFILLHSQSTGNQPKWYLLTEFWPLKLKQAFLLTICLCREHWCPVHY